MQVPTEFFEARPSKLEGAGLFKKAGVLVEGRVCRVSGRREECEERERREEGIYKFDLSPRPLSETVLHGGELKSTSNASSKANEQLDDCGARTLHALVTSYELFTCVSYCCQCVCEPRRTRA